MGEYKTIKIKKEVYDTIMKKKIIKDETISNVIMRGLESLEKRERR